SRQSAREFESSLRQMSRQSARPSPHEKRSSVSGIFVRTSPDHDLERVRQEVLQLAFPHLRSSVHHRAWMVSAAIVAALVGWRIIIIVAFRFANPGITPVTLAEKLFGRTIGGAWMPLANMSMDLPAAVITREDGRFCAHWGVDWAAMKDAVMEKKDLSALRG